MSTAISILNVGVDVRWSISKRMCRDMLCLVGKTDTQVFNMLVLYLKERKDDYILE